MKRKGEITRENILQKSLNIFLNKGISATSISDIVNEVGIQKGSLYYFFPNKENLALEALKKAKEDFSIFLSKSMKGGNPVEKLSNYFNAVLEFHRRRELKGGCIFGNSALEMSEKNEKIRNILVEVFFLWQEKLMELLEEGKKAGYFKETIDPDKVSWKIISEIEGAIMLSRTFRDIKFLEDCLTGLKMEIIK
jgi:TetR/AcrR family transcriptional repressor of nem operon